jgi:transposase
VHFPQAEKIVLVMDNLNTHKLSALYRAFEPEEARRLYERFEVHHAPKHASWLNMAECELSVLGRQCLSRRIDSHQLLTDEIAAWQQPRNQTNVRVDRQFRTPDARIKLKRLYPTLALVNPTPTGH